MDFLQELSQIYLGVPIPLDKSFSDYVDEMRNQFVKSVKHDSVCLQLLKKAHKKYPQYPCRITEMGDGGEVLVFFNVKNGAKVKEVFRKYLRELDPEFDFDLHVETKTPETTAGHYKETVKRILEERNHKNS